MEDIQSSPVPEVKPKRPLLLTVLCILTFIGSGLNFFSSFFIGLFFDQFVSAALNLAEQFGLPGFETITQAPPLFFFASALLYTGSFTGAYFMWHMRKSGFHIYTIFQILLILAPMYFLKLPGPSLFDLILSGFFVILYSTQLKIMK